MGHGISTVLLTQHIQFFSPGMPASLEDGTMILNMELPKDRRPVIRIMLKMKQL